MSRAKSSALVPRRQKGSVEVQPKRGAAQGNIRLNRWVRAARPRCAMEVSDES